MPTTSNFGWTTPADTDLVKDGAAAIRTLGNGIDTSFLDLKGGTTGQVLAKASNTDLDFTWSAADPLSILDAKGDLISATAADTPARLAVGTNGQVLAANSATSTGLEWQTISGGGMTSIASGSLSGASLVLSSIPATYNNLQIVLRNVSANANAFLALTFNAITSGYTQVGTRGTSSAAAFGQFADSKIDILGNNVANMGSAYTDNSFVINIYDYATTNTKKGDYVAFWNSSSDLEYIAFAGFYSGDSSAVISSVTIALSTGSFDNGTYVLYGVK